MTFRPPLIVTIYPRPKGAFPEYNVRILSLIAPNPSKPFHQDDWPRPAPPGKVQDSAAPTNQFPFLHPNPSKPFHQDDWSQLAKPSRPKAIVDDFVNVLLGQTFFIIHQNLWENAALSRPKAKVDDFVNLLPAQVGSVVVAPPFSQDLWESAALSRPKITDTSSSPPSSLLTPNPPTPFHQNLWEGSPAGVKARVDDFVNLTPIQSTIVVQFPFVLDDWPLAAQPHPKITDTSVAASSPLYTPNPARPFSQNSWELPVPGRPPLKSDIFVNLPAATPFSQGDWQNAVIGRQKIYAESFGIDLPLKFPNPTNPFIYSDWPRTRDRIAEVQRTWIDPFNLPLNGVLPPPPGLLPEQITDTNHLQLPINCILHGQQDYEQGETEIEANNPNYRTRTTVSHGGVGKLSQNDPTFTVKKSNRGYD